MAQQPTEAMRTSQRSTASERSESPLSDTTSHREVMASNEPEQTAYCSTAEAAQYLGKSASTVRRMIRDELLEAEEVDGNWRVPVSAVQARLVAMNREDSRDAHGEIQAAAAPSTETAPAVADLGTGNIHELVYKVFDDYRLLLTVQEAALLLGLKPKFVQKAIRLGQIPTRELVRTRFVPVQALDEWLSMRGPA